jgi:L-amino acid N-acyltransferase YncA
MSAADWPDVARIYAAGIASGSATFERETPAWESWCAARGGMPCLVAREGGAHADGDGNRARADGDDKGASGEGAVLGWAALTPVSARECYRGVGAVSIYVDPERVRRGIGGALLRALIEAAEQAGIWTVEAGIFPENAASIALHERCGFRFVGVRRRVGEMPDGGWRDVLLYERRSERVGVG